LDEKTTAVINKGLGEKIQVPPFMRYVYAKRDKLNTVAVFFSKQKTGREGYLRFTVSPQITFVYFNASGKTGIKINYITNGNKQPVSTCHKPTHQVGQYQF